VGTWVAALLPDGEDAAFRRFFPWDPDGTTGVAGAGDPVGVGGGVAVAFDPRGASAFQSRTAVVGRGGGSAPPAARVAAGWGAGLGVRPTGIEDRGLGGAGNVFDAGAEDGRMVGATGPGASGIAGAAGAGSATDSGSATDAVDAGSGSGAFSSTATGVGAGVSGAGPGTGTGAGSKESNAPSCT